MIRIDTFKDPTFGTCIRMENPLVELCISTDFGPRVLSYRLQGKRNVFHTFDVDLENIDRTVWHNFGGHRLWHAPEVTPRTYYPDNEPVSYRIENQTVILTTSEGPPNDLEKQICISLDEHSSLVRLEHRIRNLGAWDKRLAAWSLSVMRQGGVAVIPQERFIPHPDCLTPARPLVLWHFTTMDDPRLGWKADHISLRQDPEALTKQKIGAFVSECWAAYLLEEESFVKYYPNEDSDAVFPDMGCNTELYTQKEFLEIESLSALKELLPGQGIVHTEYWSLTPRQGEPEDPQVSSLRELVAQMATRVEVSYEPHTRAKE